MLQRLKPGKYYLDYGPVQMTVQAFKKTVPLETEIETIADFVRDILHELSSCLELAKMPAGLIRQADSLPLVLNNMIGAAASCDDPCLTPMAAVAGAMADAVADFLVEKGATRVLVNNGGDVALRIEEDSSVLVGITSSVGSPSHDYVLRIDGNSGIGGIATSGLGGRSFTKGIASAAVCLGKNCRIADACATVVANSTFYPHPGIKQISAEMLDPATDIPGQLVTVAVESLDDATLQKALQNGLDKGREFYNKNLINGVLIFTGKYLGAVPGELEKQVVPASEINNKGGVHVE